MNRIDMQAIIVNRFGLNRAVALTLFLKLFQASSGLLGLFLISLYFAPEVQGFYYTFASLVALQSFVELGLYLVISNVASHEWAKLSLAQDGTIHGDARALSRLVSLGRFVFRWYAIAALVFCLVVGVVGYWFLGRVNTNSINWQFPLMLHIVFSSLLLWCMPFLSLMEGCDQIATVAKFKVWQSFASNLGFWASLILGLNLWSAVVLSSISAVLCIYYLLVIKNKFFKPFFYPVTTDCIDWREEIFPMQWRLGLQGVMNYFVFGLFTPVMFHYQGPAIAGQMGMSMQLVGALQSIASIWFMTKAPRFGILISRGEFTLLDTEWRKATLLSFMMMLFGATLLIALILFGNEMKFEITNRLLSPYQIILLEVGALFAVVGHSMSIYLRAHKREVLTPIGIIVAMVMGGLVLILGQAYGAAGVVWAYVFVFSCVNFPMVCYVWKKAKLNWHMCKSSTP